MDYQSYSMILLKAAVLPGSAALYAKGNDGINFAEQSATLLESESLRRRLSAISRKRRAGSLNGDIEKQKLLRAYETALCAGSSARNQREQSFVRHRSSGRALRT